MNFGALSQGKDIQQPNGGGGMGTVICTELYRQGYYSEEIIKADREYGFNMMKTNPEIYFGYLLLADPVVKLMQKSKLFTKAIAFFAVPWAKNMAGKHNLLGEIVSTIGEPLCYIVGKIFKAERKYDQKA
jgi:hypothetical protein